MGYPTSVFNPAVRSNGQVIDASHITDVQTELTAMQTQLLGTITHSLNVSGASTMATLQAGNSTVSNLNVTGGSTFAVHPMFPPPDAALVCAGSSGAIASSALSTLAFVVEDFLTNSSVHSTGANPERLTPQSTGIYAFTAQVLLGGAPSAATTLRLSILDSSGGNICVGDEAGMTIQGYVQCHGLKRYDAVGGFAVVQLSNASGGSTLSLSSGTGKTFFAMHKIQ